MKLKTSPGPARLAQLLQPSFAFCCNKTANDGRMPTVRYAVIGCNLQQNANEGCNSCASLAGFVLSFKAAAIILSFIVRLIACFIVGGIPPLGWRETHRGPNSTESYGNYRSSTRR